MLTKNDSVFVELLSKVRAHRDLTAPALVELALARGEARLSAGGCLVADTGQHTGRSPRDKFVVRDESTEAEVWWDNNRAMSAENFDHLLADMLRHAGHGELFVQNLEARTDPVERLRVQVITELAWHSLFIRNLLVRPEPAIQGSPDLIIMDLPSFKADPARHGCRTETAIACDFSRRIVLICGSSYAGEMKKSVFTYLNYVLPRRGVMPMHCSANVGREGDVAIFFGLSGTGKTTLSADPQRPLIGDDEHGWGETGVFNFEGGCYAKAINLSAENEPEIYATTERFGTVMENVFLHPESRLPDFANTDRTENTRVAYPIDAMPSALLAGHGGQPKTLVMLTCDAFGVLPPIARLTAAETEYHFLSGYTAKVAGTERGVTEPQATFSTCFGAPFMPCRPAVYGNLLRTMIERHGVECWLINTGWTGGSFGIGTRMPLPVTRNIVKAAVNGSLKHAEFHKDPYLGLSVPVSVPGVPSRLLQPIDTWVDKEAFDTTAARVVDMFRRNFEQFASAVGSTVRDAAPSMLAKS